MLLRNLVVLVNVGQRSVWKASEPGAGVLVLIMDVLDLDHMLVFSISVSVDLVASLIKLL